MPRDLSEEEIHDVLSNKRRRLVLELLRDEKSKMTARVLSERIAEILTGESPAPRDKRQSIYVSLHQTHLPKLNRLGIVSYNSQAKTVELQDSISDVEIYMEVGPEYEISWSVFYLGLGLVGLLTVLGSYLGVRVLSSLAPHVWAYLSLLIIVVAAAYQAYQQESSLIHRLRPER